MLAAALLALLSPSDPPRSTSATLWIVDDGGGPGVDFTEVQAAVDAAADGDAILIRPGVYGGMAIDGKGLSVCGDPAGPVVLSDARIEVRNLAAGQTVLLQRLEVHGVLTLPIFAGMGLPALEVDSCAGPVRAEDCRFLPSDLETLLLGLRGGGGARVAGSGAVSLARCALAGGVALSDGPYGGLPGLAALSSSVVLYDCQLAGAFGPGADCGAFGGCGQAGAAGHGAFLQDALVFASGCSFAGGDGGGGASCLPFGFGGDGADGGDGAHLSAGATLRALACAFTAGDGGPSPACTPGAAGLPVASDGGTFVPLEGTARSLRVTSPVQGGTPALIEIAAAPGDLLFGLASPAAAYLPLDAFDGVLLCQPTALAIPLGATPTGALALPVATPPPPPGVGAVVHYLQVAALTTGGAIQIGSGATLVILE